VAYEIKERSLGEILEGAFQLYRDHFAGFVTIALCVAVPTTLLTALASWLFTGHTDAAAAFEAIDSQALANAEANPAAARAAVEMALRALLATAIALPIAMAGTVLQSAAMTLIISDAYLGQPLSVASGFRRAFARLWPLMGASALAGVGILLGLLCLIVPGILLMIRWMFTTQAIVIEGNDASASLGRSHELSRGNAGSLFGLLVTLGVLGFVLHLVQGALVPDAVEAIPGLRELLGLVPQMLVTPLSAAAVTLAYFDARVRNEGFDLQQLALGLGPAGRVAPPP
jgi:hypothetical protein